MRIGTINSSADRGFHNKFFTRCSLTETIEQGLLEKKMEHTQMGWFGVIL